MADKKTKALKGVKKVTPDKDSDSSNPLLSFKDREDFKFTISNLFENPSSLIYHGYDIIGLSGNSIDLDSKKINENTRIVIILRYYEYVCAAEMNFSFMVTLLQSDSGMSIKDVIDMIKHGLRNRLLLNAPSFDSIFEPEIKYMGRVKYNV